MTAEPFTTAGENLTCQGCGGTIRANTGMYLVPEAATAPAEDAWACSPECGRAAGLRIALDSLAARLENAIDDLRVVTSGGIPAA